MSVPSAEVPSAGSIYEREREWAELAPRLLSATNFHDSTKKIQERFTEIWLFEDQKIIQNSSRKLQVSGFRKT